jgi:hypothetical protein
VGVPGQVNIFPIAERAVALDLALDLVAEVPGQVALHANACRAEIERVLLDVRVELPPVELKPSTNADGDVLAEHNSRAVVLPPQAALVLRRGAGGAGGYEQGGQQDLPHAMRSPGRCAAAVPAPALKV